MRDINNLEAAVRGRDGSAACGGREIKNELLN